MPQPYKLFTIYAREDAQYLEELPRHEPQPQHADQSQQRHRFPPRLVFVCRRAYAPLALPPPRLRLLTYGMHTFFADYQEGQGYAEIKSIIL